MTKQWFDCSCEDCNIEDCKILFNTKFEEAASRNESNISDANKTLKINYARDLLDEVLMTQLDPSKSILSAKCEQACINITEIKSLVTTLKANSWID